MISTQNFRERVTYQIAVPLLGIIILVLVFYLGSNIVDFFKVVPDFKNISQLEILGRNITFLVLLTGIISTIITDLMLLLVFVDYKKSNQMENK